MANPILKSEIIENGLDTLLEKVNGEFVKMIGNLTDLRSGYVQTAQTIGQNVTANSNNAESLLKEAAALGAVEEGIKKVDSTTKMLTEDKKRLNEEARKYKKLTDEEKESVKKLSSDLEYYVKLMHSQNEANQKLGQLYAKNIAEIDIQKKSYNELYQTYNAINEALKKMTTEERLSSDAGKAMTAQAYKIRDTLNELQKSTGNYTLQVGKYRAAFDGLGYSMQQILREAPSALNLNQFFLAISNNIPMFLDQLKAFKQEQDEIKKNLEEMTEGTQEYMEQQEKQMSVGKKLLTSILNWQTAVLVGLMLLRKLPDVISKISDRIKTLREGLDKTTSYANILTDVQIKTIANVIEEETRLGFLCNALDEATQGSQRYADITKEIGEIIGQTIDPINTEASAVRDLTEAYKENAEQMARNKIVEEMVSTSRLNKIKRDTALQALKAGDFDKAAVVMGWSGEDAKKYRKMYENAKGNYGWFGNFVTSAFPASTIPYQMYAQGSGMADIMGTITNATPFISDEDMSTMEKELWEFIKSITNDSGRGGSKPKENNIEDKYWESQEAIIKITTWGYEQERKLADLSHQKQEEELRQWLVEQNRLLDEDVKNGFKTKVEADAIRKTLDDQAKDVRLGIAEDLRIQLLAIDNKELEDTRKLNEQIKKERIEADKERMQGIIDTANKEMVVVKRRARTAVEEQHRNEGLVHNIKVLIDEEKALTSQQYLEAESMDEAQKKAEKLRKEIEKLAQSVDFSKSIKNYSSFGDIIKRNISVGDGTKNSIVTSIFGKDTMEVMAKGLGEGFQDWVDENFDKWAEQATQAVSTWYDTTMGYIGDLMQAYADLAQAKAEAAAEATEAAQEEYDKEKALLEAGYASRVEATWAEYQEKKAAQEQAEKDAKAAAEAQQQLNEISTAGNLITAASNLYKSLSGLGPIGIAAATVAIGGMIAAFVAAKSKAYEVSKYGEGGFEVLEGGSHASGNDIDLGVRNRRGRRMHVEGKEGLGIFSRRAMAHYGANNIEAMVNSVNRLEFEGNAAKRMSLERSVGMQILSMPRTDLHRLESGMDKLVSYGARSIHHNPDGTVVETRKNARIVYKNI